MKQSLIFLITLGLSNLFAQNVKYSVVQTHAKLPYLQIGFIATGADLALNFGEIDHTQINFGMGIDAKLNLGNALHLQAYGFSANYVDLQRLTGLDDGIVGAENRLEADQGRAFDINLGGSFTPFIKKRNVKHRVNLKSTWDWITFGKSYATTTSYINVQGKEATIFGFRGGITRYRYNIMGNLATESGERFSDHYASLNATALYGGLTFTAYGFVKVKTVRYGMKDGGGLATLYADILWGPDSRMEMVSQGQIIEVVSASNQAFGNSPFGIRAGGEIYPHTKWGVGYRVEGGIRPGYSRAPYMRFDLILPVFNLNRPKAGLLSGKS